MKIRFCPKSSLSSFNHHHVLGLQEPPHDVENSGLAHVGEVLVRGQGGEPSHQKVEPAVDVLILHRIMSILPWSWNQRCDETDKIVVHVAWVSQGGRGHRHNRRYQLVNLKIDNKRLSHVVGGQKGCVEPGRVLGLQCEASLWQSERGRCCPRRPRSQQPWQLL